MKFIKGTERHSNECGGNRCCWTTPSAEDIAAHPGAVVEPVGSFHCATCYVARETSADGRTVDIRVIANPTQQWWDDCYDQEMIVPSAPGAKINVERLDQWFNIKAGRTVRREVRMTVMRTIWRRAVAFDNCNCHNTEKLLSFLKKEAQKHPKVVLYAGGSLRPED